MRNSAKGQELFTPAASCNDKISNFKKTFRPADDIWDIVWVLLRSYSLFGKIKLIVKWKVKW